MIDHVFEAAHEAWEMRILDEHLDLPDAEEPEVYPVYEVNGILKETATGRVLTDEEADDLGVAWNQDKTVAEIIAAEKEAEYLVLAGKLK